MPVSGSKPGDVSGMLVFGADFPRTFPIKTSRASSRDKDGSSSPAGSGPFTDNLNVE